MSLENFATVSQVSSSAVGVALNIGIPARPGFKVVIDHLACAFNGTTQLFESIVIQTSTGPTTFWATNYGSGIAGSGIIFLNFSPAGLEERQGVSISGDSVNIIQAAMANCALQCSVTFHYEPRL